MHPTDLTKYKSEMDPSFLKVSELTFFHLSHIELQVSAPFAT